MTRHLNERLSSRVYHFTDLGSAVGILKDQAFLLSTSVGAPNEVEMGIAGYPYYFSTTRTLLGNYHNQGYQTGVMFNLDGDYYNRHYPSRSVDYYKDRTGKTTNQSSEAEDRLFSRKSKIPIAGVTSIHVLVTPQEAQDYLPMAQLVMQLAVSQGIACYFYNNASAWLRQRGGVDVADSNFGSVDVPIQHPKRVPAFLRDPDAALPSDRHDDYSDDWRELVEKSTVESLSPVARKLAAKLIKQPKDTSIRDLSDDIRAHRSPSNIYYEQAVWLVDYIHRKYRSHSDNNKLRLFVNDLVTKWKSITSDELTERLLREWRCDWHDSDARQDQHGEYNSQIFNPAASEIYQHVFNGDTVFLQMPDTDTAYVVRRPKSWRLLKEICQQGGGEVDRKNCRFYGTVPLSFRYIPGCDMLKIVSTENLERLGRWRKAQRNIEHTNQTINLEPRFDLGPGVYQITSK